LLVKEAKESAEAVVQRKRAPKERRGLTKPEGPNLLTKVVSTMRKSKEQQKKESGTQLNIFSGVKREPVSQPVDGINRWEETGVELQSRLEKQRALTENILDEIVAYGNLTKGYEQVRKNGGSSGIDEMDIAGLQQWLEQHIEELRSALLKEEYKVESVRKVEIPKPGGGIRTLGVPTVKDRLIQQAIQQELSRYYEPHFSEQSYGFRPGRNAQQAILRASEYIKEGNEWVVDIDLEKFFDKINHDRLMQRLSKGIGDKRLLRLINAYLKAGMMESGIEQQRTAGTPQGSPLSPLLSNIVLDELDRELEKRGHHFCRYADDCNIYVKSKRAGERVMASVIGFIEGKLKLKVNREKSGVRHCSEVKFLGYTLLPGGDIRVADKSVERLKEKVKEITGRNRGVKFEQVVQELNALTRGWTNYFGLANKWLSTFTDIDAWIRRKLRCYKLKQCGKKYAIQKMLCNLGVTERSSWNVVMYSQGWWKMSSKVAVTQAMNLKWFMEQGLQSLSIRMQV
jgi:RNA-directed DNA polymerase